MGSCSNKDAKPSDEAIANVRSQINSNPVMMYTKSTCPYCNRAKSLLEKMKVAFTFVQLDKEGANIASAVRSVSGMETVPVTYIAGEKIGGCDDLVAGIQNGTVQEKLRNAGLSFEEIKV